MPSDSKRSREDSSVENMATLTIDQLETKISAGDYQIGEVIVAIFKIVKENAGANAKTDVIIEKIDAFKEIADNIKDIKTDVDNMKTDFDVMKADLEAMKINIGR